MNTALTKVAVSAVIPFEYARLFPYEHFNEMQSFIAQEVYGSDNNKLIAAPTGSGKTVLAELGILRKLVKSPTNNKERIKCLYIAPTKALCSQISIEWSNKYNVTGMIVKEITGDTEQNTDVIHIIETAQIIITTPEKWDSVTRNWRNDLSLFAKIDLILLDEIHFVGNSSRGGTYENIVTRMRIIYEEGKKLIHHEDNLRFIALTATLPDLNMAEFGAWLNCTKDSIHYFGKEFRPIPLHTHVLSYPLNGQNNYMFEKTLNAKVVDVVNNYSHDNQTLIFASTQNGAEDLASFLLNSKQVSIVIPTCNNNDPTEYVIEQDINSIENDKLKTLIRAGYAFHHRGISDNDKSVVIKLYLMGKLRILCSTSTLATGINLSAHLVIIKGTIAWRGTEYEAIPRHEIIQMLGRAGRMGLGCNYGVGVIMCGKDQAHLYENIEDRTEEIKSQLQTTILEAIAVEVANGYIVDMDNLMIEWYQLSLCYTQLRKLCESDYKYNLNLITQELLLSAITKLKNGQIVKYDAKSGAIKPSSFCHIMSRNMIKFSTMQLILELKDNSSIQDIVSQMCKSSELKNTIILRRGEKNFLNDAMKHVSFPLDQNVETPELKAYVLILLMMVKTDKVAIENFTLRLEQREICDNLLRLCAAITQVSVKRKFGFLLNNTNMLDRSIKLGKWDDFSVSPKATFLSSNKDDLDGYKAENKTHLGKRKLFPSDDEYILDLNDVFTDDEAVLEDVRSDNETVETKTEPLPNDSADKIIANNTIEKLPVENQSVSPPLILRTKMISICDVFCKK